MEISSHFNELKGKKHWKIVMKEKSNAPLYPCAYLSIKIHCKMEAMIHCRTLTYIFIRFALFLFAFDNEEH